MSCRLSKLILLNQEDRDKVESIERKLDKLKSIPSGTIELLWELESEGECVSYCNERIMWVGWQLEKNGIEVEWGKE